MSQEVIEVIERQVEVVEVIERGPQGPSGEVAALNWDSITNKPSAFPPEPHTHVVNDVVDLATTPLPVLIKVKNTSGLLVVKGTPVYATGSVGDTIVSQISPARSDDPNKIAVAILNQNLLNNQEGLAPIIGELAFVDTSLLQKGPIYLAPTGGLTNTKPTNPSHFVQWLGTCERVNVDSGTLYVNVTGPHTPDESFAKTIGQNDIEITDPTRGLILRSTTTNTRWRITIDDNGTLTATNLV